jgi:ABC-2 type transport system permease protein
MRVRTLRALIAVQLRASFALRGAFLLQAGFMLLNNLLYFSTWWIFFDRFEEIRGWRFADMTLLYGIVAASHGISMVLFGGSRDLARRIADGDVDTWLARPTGAAVQALTSRSYAHGWGDVVTGAAFLLWAADPAVLPIALVAVAISATAHVSSILLAQSAAFWFGDVESLARQLFELTITFAMYPSSLFTGPLRLVLFTLIPAGFVGFLPADLVREFRPGTLALACAGAATYAALAGLAFRAGLRRYASGSRFSVQG